MVCVACGVGEAVVLLGFVAPLVMDEVVETMDDEDDFGELEDRRVVVSVEEAALEDAAADGPTLLGTALEAAAADGPTLLGSPPQVSGSVRAFVRSCTFPEQKPSIECSSGAAGSNRQYLKPHSPLFKG